MATRVKICGITNREDAEAAIAAGADALGFILFSGSKRFIPMEAAIRIVETLPPFVTTVAVTVNAVKEFTNLGYRKQLKNFGVAQLHGQESPAHVKAVSKYLPVIKVFPAERCVLNSEIYDSVPKDINVISSKIGDAMKHLEGKLGRKPNAEEMAAESGLPVGMIEALSAPIGPKSVNPFRHFNEYISCVSAFMLDTPSAEHGGTGRVFDWSLATEFKARIGGKPLVLAGGLSPENVAKAIATVQPYAVDVVSGVEASPGRKDHAKLRDFIQICKSL